MAEFCNRHPILVLLFLFWLSGAVVRFILLFGAAVWRLLTRNSLRNRNLWLIGFEVDWVGGLLREKEPGENPWKDQVSLLWFLAFMAAIDSALSWIGVLITLIATLVVFYKWLTTPAKIREMSWRAGNIEYRCAEDFLQLAQEGYLPGSTGPSSQNLAEARAQVERIARKYADRVFPDDPEMADKYVELAGSLSEKRFGSKVIHPQFWMIPFTKAAAEHITGFRFSSLSKTRED
ncbi:MAG: hypothetical protein HS132_09605 [Planctomycetia bacterium]|nr:hypothetical protein [Planctomycetia bacterium]